MKPNEILDDIIRNLDPEQIPPDYIIMAKITDFDGNEQQITGKDLIEFMKNPFENAVEARIILDIRKIRQTIIEWVNFVYDEVNKRYAAKKKGDLPD